MYFRLLLALILLIPSKFHAQEISRRNVIFILIDDQRYDFLSYHNHPWIKTPNIDRLAENGIYFSQAYVTTSLCSPSRASILTGQYAHTHQVMDNNTEVPNSTQTFPLELQKQGYHTAFIGKWHMGGRNDAPRPGFDYWASFKGQGSYENPDMNINGSIVSHEGYTPDILTDYAIEFINKHQDKNQPYCLYLSHKSIHEPFTPAPRHQGVYKDIIIPKPDTYEHTEEFYHGKPRWLKRQRTSWHGAERDYSIQNYGSYDRFFQLYSECMLAVDESIGRITKTLEEIGQLEETVIIYFSDNGYMMGEQGLIDKRVMYEPSIKVPCFVHCPKMIPEPRTDPHFVLSVDIGPTILDLAGIGKPETMHGTSFLPLIEGDTDEWRTSFLYEYFIDPFAPQTPTILGLRTERYSYMTYHGVWDSWELYDMEKDPDQTMNLLGDISYGNDYGTFLRHVEQQDPTLYTLVKSLDQQLSQKIEATGGSRVPTWKK